MKTKKMKTKTKRMKKSKLIEVNQCEVNLYKRYFIFNEFQKIIKDVLIYDFDEELYEYVMSVIDINTIINFSDYGDKVFDLDYRDYILENKCFLCFVKFDFEEFVQFICEDFIESRYE